MKKRYTLKRNIKWQKNQSYTEEDREKCIKLIDSAKMSYKEISEKYNIPKGTIAGWVKRYREEGTLKTKKRGRPKKQQDKDAQIESFHACLKRETIHSHHYCTHDQYVRAIIEWIEFYNNDRIRLAMQKRKD